MVCGELLRRRREQRRGVGHLHRRIGILARTPAFERIAAVHDPAIEIARLAADAAQIFELVEMRLELVVTHAPVLDRHVFG
jgi:hypothetical protein